MPRAPKSSGCRNPIARVPSCRGTMTSFIQTLGESMKGCTGCANKRSPAKQLEQGKRGGNTLSHGPSDAIDMSDEALEESEALINLIETAITRRKEKLKEAGVDDGTSSVDMAQLKDVERALGAAGAPVSSLTSGLAAAAAMTVGAAVAGGTAVAGGAAKAAGATKAGEKVLANGKAAANAVAAVGGAAVPPELRLTPTSPTKPADPSRPGTAAAVPPEVPPADKSVDEHAECALPSLFPISRPTIIDRLPCPAPHRAAPHRTAPHRSAPHRTVFHCPTPRRTALLRPPDADAPHALCR